MIFLHRSCDYPAAKMYIAHSALLTVIQSLEGGTSSHPPCHSPDRIYHGCTSNTSWAAAQDTRYGGNICLYLPGKYLKYKARGAPNIGQRWFIGAGRGSGRDAEGNQKSKRIKKS